MTRHVLIQIEPVDEAVMAEYRARVLDSARRHGGHQVAGGAGSEVLEENGIDVRASVLAAFPDEAAVRAWIADPEIADVHALRRRGSHSLVILLAEPRSAV